jgi:hypothetical protein
MLIAIYLYDVSVATRVPYFLRQAPQREETSLSRRRNKEDIGTSGSSKGKRTAVQAVYIGSAKVGLSVRQLTEKVKEHEKE